MVESHRHAVGVITANHKIFADSFNLETIVINICKSFKHNMFGIFRYHTVHQSAHGDNFRIGFFFSAREAHQYACKSDEIQFFHIFEFISI